MGESGSIKTEKDDRSDLKGMPSNPGRDPKRRPKDGKGSIGDTALSDALIVVAVCWGLLILLAWSLRQHNI